MAARSTADVTRLLGDWRKGNSEALDELLPLVHHELRQRARRHMRRERKDHTLQTTALVNEAFLRLVEHDRIQFRDREHFYKVASIIMRRILLDHGRKHRAEKRGGGARHVPLDEGAAALPEQTEDAEAVLCKLDDALARLHDMDPRQARIVELRFLEGKSLEETAAALDISKATVKRDWQLARAWLRREMHRS